MSNQEKHLYEFGPFRLDIAEHLLLRNGKPVPLTAKAFEVLQVLIQHSGHLVEKDQLMKEVWPGQFVEEGNLTVSISTLRKVLGDDQQRHRYLETVPKRGYRFVAVVREVEAEGADLVVERHTRARITAREEVGARSDGTADRVIVPQPASSEDVKSKLKWRSRSVAVLLAILLVGLAGALYYSWIASKTRESEARVGVRSIAVLPFRPMGTEGGDEYLGPGLADVLITKLSNIRQLAVRPTSSVRKYASQEQDPVAAGRELRVESVLEGSVQRSGDRIRVTVQLVSVRDGAPLWAGKFDEKFTDVFAVQDSITEQVAQALMLELGSEEQKRLTKHYTENSEAYQLYMKGRYFWNKRTVKGLKKGIGYFNEAVEKDPSYALAYVGLADSYSLLSDYEGLPPKQAYPQAKKAAMQALELDGQLAEAHAALAFIKAAYDWDWPGAEREYRRAIELNPNYETAHQWYAEYLSGMGRHEEAIAEIRRAKEIDPLSLIINAVEAWVLYYAREYDQAIAQGQKVVEMDPHFAEVYEYLKRCYDQKGMYREAIAARQMRRKFAGYDAEETAALREASAATSAGVYWQKRLEQDVEESRREPSAAFEMAEIFAQLGKKDQAFAWLERAYEERSFFMMYLKVAPNLDPLRSDPRFADLVRRVGLAP